MTQHHTDDPARELRRVVDRCASYPPARWGQPRDDGRLPSEIVHGACQLLADLAADGAGRPRRAVPVLRVHGLADQVRVLAADALAEAPDAEATIAELLADVRRAL